MSNNDYQNEKNEHVPGGIENKDTHPDDEASTIEENRSEQDSTNEQQTTYIASSEKNQKDQKLLKAVSAVFLAEHLEELFLPYLLSCSWEINCCQLLVIR